MDEKESCAYRIRQGLKIRGLTQKDLCDKTAIPKSAMSQYCSGAFVPKQKRTALIAQALDVNEAWLMGYDVPMERETRNIQPPPPNVAPLPKMREWKVLGATACGKPLHRELLDETVMAPDDIKADVVFRCVGDSMINARIFDGDAVFVRLQPEVENGQIAVVRVDDEYTLKRVYRHEDYVELRPENPVHKAIILRGSQLDPENFEVVGLAAAFMSVIQ